MVRLIPHCLYVLALLVLFADGFTARNGRAGCEDFPVVTATLGDLTDLFVHGWAVANTPSSSFENDTLSVVAFLTRKTFAAFLVMVR